MADQPYFDPAAKDADCTLSNSNRTASLSGAGSVRSTNSVSSGKWYVLATCNAGGGVSNWQVGFVNGSHSVTSSIGSSANGWAKLGSTLKAHNSVTASYGTSVANSDVVMLAFDADSDKCWVGENGTWYSSGDPAAGTSEMYSGLTGAIYLAFGASSGTRTLTLLELSDTNYSTYPAPSGFTAGWGGSASAITGTASITEAGDSLSSTSTLRIQAAATVTEAGDSLSAVIGITPVLAVGAITEADDSVSSAGALLIQGSASITGDDDSLTGAGALFIIAASSAIEEDDSVASAAALLIQGGAAIGEGADLISSAGTLPIYGTSGLAEADDSVIANDYVPRGRADLDEDDDLIRFHGGISAEWMQEQATKGDIPNWNHCARCHKEMRPNQMLQQNQRIGSSVVWTGIYVCPDCWDPIHPQDRWPRKTGGDPRPVPNARPFRGG